MRMCRGRAEEGGRAWVCPTGWTAAPAAGEGRLLSPPGHVLHTENTGAQEEEEVGLDVAVSVYSIPARENVCELGVA